jgi:solute carrier family 10 (sodium/bile acid cotransporter), member 7
MQSMKSKVQSSNASRASMMSHRSTLGSRMQTPTISSMLSQSSRFHSQSHRYLGSLRILQATLPSIHRHPNRSRNALRCRAAAVGPGPLHVAPVTKFLRFVDANYIPIALIGAISFGWVFPGPGTLAAARNLQTFSTIGIFIISGILLQRGEAVAALRSPVALAFGIISTLFITPLAAFGVMRLPLHPPEMALGLAVFCCVPTTLSTCVTLSNACKGNSAVALLLVIVTNVLGVFTIPAMLSLVLGGSAAGAASFNPTALFKSLVKFVLLPLLGGVVLQTTIPGLPQWRTNNRKLLSYLSTMFLCLVPWMQLSVAASSNLPLTAQSVAAAAIAGAALHMVFLVFNTLIAGMLRFNGNKKQDVAIRKAVILCTSEKTLPVAVAVVNQLAAAGAGAAAGFAVVPCILAHLLQIAIDSAVVSNWNKKDAEAAAAVAGA